MLCACLFCLHLAVHVHFLADHIAPHPNWTLLTSYYHKLGKLWRKVGAMFGYKIEKSNSPLNNSCIWRFPKMVVPQIIRSNRIFQYKPSVLGTPFMESPGTMNCPVPKAISWRCCTTLSCPLDPVGLATIESWSTARLGDLGVIHESLGFSRGSWILRVFKFRTCTLWALGLSCWLMPYFLFAVSRGKFTRPAIRQLPRQGGTTRETRASDLKFGADFGAFGG